MRAPTGRSLLCGVLLLLAAGPSPSLAQEAPARHDRVERVPEARAMVQLRDRWFLLNPVGRAAVDFYYRWSPYAAFAVEQPGRDRHKALAVAGIAGLRGLFRGALLWMPAAGALIVLWLAAALSALLRRVPGAREWGGRNRGRLLAGAVAAFLAWVAWAQFHPDAIDQRARIAAIREAFERGEFAADAVQRWSTDADPDVRYEIFYALAERPSAEDRAIFLAGLEDPDLRVRSWALNGLGNLGDREAVPAIVRTLSSPIYNIRYRAAWALGAIGDPAAIGPLQDLLRRDPHVYVRYYAADALDKFQDLPGGK